MNAVIDEDLPRSFAIVLHSLGLTALDVRDHGLRGKSDEKVYKFAQKKESSAFFRGFGIFKPSCFSAWYSLWYLYLTFS